MKQILITISLFTIFNFSVFSAQAEIVGKAVVDGKVVLLNSDKTWKFESTETASTCQALSATVSFCPPTEHAYTKLPKQAPDQLAMFIRNGMQYGAIIEEKVGLSDGLTDEFMLNAIEANMVMGGARKDEIVVADHQKVQLGGREATQVAYLVKLSGLNFVFMYTFGMSENTSLQFITWTVGKQLQQFNKDMHADFIDQLKTDWQ